MRHKLLLILILGCPAALAEVGENLSDASAATNADLSAGGVSLDDVAGLVRSHNPRLKAARFLLAEAQGRLKGAGRWKNPSLQTNYQTDSEGYEIQGGVGLIQSFPLAGRLRWEKDVTRVMVEAVEVEILDVERHLISEAKTLAVQVMTIESQKALRNRQLILAQELSSLVKMLLKRGEASELDVGQAKLDETSLELEVHHLDHEAKRLRGKLKVFLGLPPESVLKMRDGLPVPRSNEETGVNLMDRPDYRAAVKRADAAGREIGLAKANRWQDVSLGLFALRMRQQDRPIGLIHEERVGVQLSVPLPLWQRNRGLIEEKTAAAGRWQQTVEALENEILNEVVASRTVMNTLAIHAQEVRDDLLPEARRNVEAIGAAYRDGLVDLSALLRARAQAVELESKYLVAIEDYHLARVRYEAARGIFH